MISQCYPWFQGFRDILKSIQGHLRAVGCDRSWWCNVGWQVAIHFNSLYKNIDPHPQPRWVWSSLNWTVECSWLMRRFSVPCRINREERQGISTGFMWEGAELWGDNSVPGDRASGDRGVENVSEFMNNPKATGNESLWFGEKRLELLFSELE